MKLSQLFIPNLFIFSIICEQVKKNNQQVQTLDNSGLLWVKTKAKSLTDRIPIFFKHNTNITLKEDNKDNKDKQTKEEVEKQKQHNIKNKKEEEKKGKYKENQEFNKILHHYFKFNEQHQRDYSAFLDDKEVVEFKNIMNKIIENLKDTNNELYERYNTQLNKLNNKIIYKRSFNIWKAIGDLNQVNPFPKLHLSIFFHGWLSLFFPLFFSIGSLVVIKSFFSLYFNK